ncbi:MAG: peptidylprolyl isomerase [Candidatus Micrarchaeota archaeon]
MFEEKDFLKVEFSVRSKAGDLIDTTDEASAKKAGVYDEHKRYGESLVVLSDQRMIKGFRNALLAAEAGKAQTVTLSPADAFGERDETLIKLIPLQKFKDNGVSPVVGMPVTLDQYRGRVQSVSGGRVRVDLNHELAGKEVTYEFTVKKCITGDAEKLEAIIDEAFQGGVSAAIAGKEAHVKAGMKALSAEGYGDRKAAALQNALLYIPEISKITWTEEFERG